ncbi:TenA family protein [Legionella sp. CNM-4043-24]|uniref:TenA family protein n=1 Tax=Legionella sp. CNM-4043-24 TaxID=3421646 RepID=UPI00403A809D
MFKLMLEKSADTLSAIYNHSFNQQLQQGTLAKRVFYHYLEQDALYLNAFAKALKGLARRLDDPQHQQQFHSLAADTLQAEQDLHTRYFQAPTSPRFFSSSRQTIDKIQVIEAYTQHLLQTAKHAPVEVAMAACIPCFWVYRELGIQMSEKERVPDNPYQDWIDTYSWPGFVTATEALIITASSLCDEVSCPERQRAILLAFQQSAEYELQFFDEARLVDEHDCAFPIQQ